MQATCSMKHLHLSSQHLIYFVSLQALEELGLDAGNLVDEAPSFIKS